MAKIALITGITGQDGSYLAEQLLAKGYSVHGIVRRTSQLHRENIVAAQSLNERGTGKLELHYGNLNDPLSLARVISAVSPDEIYNLASDSHVGISFLEPELAAISNGLGALRIFEIVRHSLKRTRVFQPSTAELFGGHQQDGEKDERLCYDETSAFVPLSPYAIAKQFAHSSARMYRQAYGLHLSCGILFNHESPRRGLNFVTRKISHTIAAVAAGQQRVLTLGDFDSRRDWGYAPDYVDAMWRMLQAEVSGDYVIATGQLHSVREFVEIACSVVGLRLEWSGEGRAEVGLDRDTGNILVQLDSRYQRPADHGGVCGSSAKAHRELGWKPSVSFPELVEIMVRADLQKIRETTPAT